MKEIINYAIMVSRNFPATHPRKGQLTYFKYSIHRALMRCGKDCYRTPLSPTCKDCVNMPFEKIHTIRENYLIWEKRMKKIEAGEAFLSICEWALPGGRWNKNNTKIEICRLGKEDGIGIQKLKFEYAGLRNIVYAYIGESKEVGVNIPTLANNDGLEPIDFKDWFNGSKNGDSLAIIHFTKFRY